ARELTVAPSGSGRYIRADADVAELADAQPSGGCGRKVVEVQVLSSAPTRRKFRNPKLEIRNNEANPNDGKPVCPIADLGISDLFRISDFVLRISCGGCVHAD